MKNLETILDNLKPGKANLIKDDYRTRTNIRTVDIEEYENTAAGIDSYQNQSFVI